MSTSPNDAFARHFRDDDFWAKLHRYARRAGRELVERAVLLYLVLLDRHTPAWAKTTVIGALGYFIAPIDAIPDLIPGVGFTDDLAVLALAAATVASSITPAIRQRARRVVERWLGAGGHGFPGREVVIEVDAEVVAREPSN